MTAYTDLGYGAFDADNHYYEAADSFTRHIPKGMEKRTMQWAEIDGKRRLLVAGRVNRFIPNPLFDPVARPGSLDDYFRGKTPGDDIRAAFGALEPINPGYRSPAARIPMMDAQHLDACFMFPTLGVGIEEALLHDVEACHTAFHSFNQYLLDEWKFDYDGRILTAPYLCLQDPAAAEREVDFALANGARVVVMRSGPVRGPGFARSPGDPIYDGVWSRLAEAGIAVAYHSGDAGYNRYAEDWGRGGEMQAFVHDPFIGLTGGYRPIHDTIAALIVDGVFTRFPRVRVATIESGSDWVKALAKGLKKSYSQRPSAYTADPIEQLRSNVWVSPYYEDDLQEVIDAIGVEHVLFGSDYPHAEGLADPCSYVDDLAVYGITGDAARKVMRDNGMALATPI